MFNIDKNRVIRLLSKAGRSGENFSTQGELQILADEQKWSKADLTAIWNKFAGAPPFEKLKRQTMFKNRPYGIAQIWKAIQVLKTVDVKPTPAKVAKAPKPKKEAKVRTPKQGTKKEKVIQLMSREGGVTATALMEAIGWQAHSVRGFISTLQSKHGMKVSTERHPDKGTIYKIA